MISIYKSFKKQKIVIKHLNELLKLLGEFKGGIRHGKGTYFFKDSSKYEGEFLNDLYHGNGKFTDISGKVITGIWKEGVKLNK